MEHTLSLSPALGFTTQEHYEYSLLANPGEEVFKKIMEEKEIFSLCYKVKLAKKITPHITVANFFAKESMEDTLIKWANKIISTQYSFDVMLNNFSGLPASQTIYTRVQDHDPFKRLAASLKTIDEYIRNNGFPRATLSNHPYITIAERLQPAVYEKALKDYSQKTFNASFTVRELILLKRQNQYDQCKQVAVFRMATSFKA
ncbi:MAG: 2'-5' RNA ligase family protein [Ginsengibacter sp.]